MKPTFSFHYSGGPTGHQYQSWREDFCRRWIAADFIPIGESQIMNEMTGTSHGPVTICTTRGTPVRMMGRSPTNTALEDSIYLVIASNARVQVAHKGVPEMLELGEMALMMPGDVSEVMQLTAGSRTSVRVPRKSLASMTRNMSDGLVKKIQAPDALRNLLFHQIQLAHQVATDLDVDANQALAVHILDLMALAVGPRQGAVDLAARRGLAAARIEAIKADILGLIREPNLRLETVAARHRMSERALQLLFEAIGTTFTDFVREHRLQLAKRELSSPANKWRKVSDIAMTSGFGDISYFNRCFRERFNVTPSEARTSPLAL